MTATLVNLDRALVIPHLGPGRRVVQELQDTEDHNFQVFLNEDFGRSGSQDAQEGGEHFRLVQLILYNNNGAICAYGQAALSPRPDERELVVWDKDGVGGLEPQDDLPEPLRGAFIGYAGLTGHLS